MKEFQYTVKDACGIHARPAGLLVKVVKGFSSTATLEKNGKTCDLKQDATARSMLQMMDTAPKKGFDLTVTDPADVTGFLRYMLEAGRMDRVAG